MDTKPNTNEKIDLLDNMSPSVAIMQIYTKSSSFESYHMPKSTQDIDIKPTVHVDFESKTNQIDAEKFEVVLMLNISVQEKEKSLYSIKVAQAGLFSLRNLNENELKQVLMTYCPNSLFPYARQMISEAIIAAGFPAIYLIPIDFSAIYANQMSKNQDERPTVAQEKASNHQAIDA